MSTDAATAANPSSDVLRHVRKAREVMAVATPAARSAGLSMEGFLALAALRDVAPRGLSMSELARATGATPPTLTRHIDALATNSLVYREIDPEDRRSTLIHLSKLGVARLRAAEESLVALR